MHPEECDVCDIYTEKTFLNKYAITPWQGKSEISATQTRAGPDNAGNVNNFTITPQPTLF